MTNYKGYIECESKKLKTSQRPIPREILQTKKIFVFFYAINFVPATFFIQHFLTGKKINPVCIDLQPFRTGDMENREDCANLEMWEVFPSKTTNHPIISIYKNTYSSGRSITLALCFQIH